MKLHYLFLALLGTAVPAFAQQKAGVLAPNVDLTALYKAGKFAELQQVFEAQLEIETSAAEKTEIQKVLAAVHSVWADRLVKTSDFASAIAHYQKAYQIDELLRRREAGDDLNNIGEAYWHLSQNEKALKFYNQALPIRREVNDRDGEAVTLQNIGAAYASLSQYDKALEFLNQALPLRREIKNRDGEAMALSSTGTVYASLKQYEKALIFFNQALPLYRKVHDRPGEARVLQDIGFAFDHMNEPEKSLTFLGQALPIFREVNDRRGEAETLQNIGAVFDHWSEPEKSLTFYNLALPIYDEIKDRRGKANTLTGIGLAYLRLSQYETALSFFNQALPLRREVHDRSGEAATLINLMWVYKEKKQPQLAILYGKQSVNVLQSIRADIQHLPKESQRAYLAANRHTYETLAALLIEQNRLEEAEQVLRFLRLEDAFEFAGRDPKLGKELAVLLQPLSFTPDEKKQLPADSKAVVGEGAEESRVWQGVLWAGEAGGAGRAALLSTFNTDDTFYVLLATAKGRRAFSFPVKKADFDALSARLHAKLSDPHSDPREDAQKMERIAFCDGKLEQALREADIERALWFPSGSLRAIPIDALYDGAHYLVENPRLNLEVTLISRRYFDAGSAPKVFAGGGSLRRSLTVDERKMEFPELPGVTAELRAIVHDPKHEGVGPFEGDIYPDAEFDQKALAGAASKHENVLHLATHFYLHPGGEGGSFLLLGDGTTLPLEDWRAKFQLRGVELLTLSACETDADENAGREVSSLAEVSQWLGARAVLASHWSVDDNATARLMADFYTRWQAKPTEGKAVALRDAQRAFLGNPATPDPSRPRRPLREGENPTARAQTRYAHPYYWAPFTLIGNWR